MMNAFMSGWPCSQRVLSGAERELDVEARDDRARQRQVADVDRELLVVEPE